MSGGLLLASRSPRRRALIGLLGLPVRVAAAAVDETPQPHEPPAAYVARLAVAKAQALRPRARRGEWVVAADTAVVDGQDILGKPAHPAEATAMLRRLRGRSHHVLTGVAVLPPAGECRAAVVHTTVHMRPLSDAEIAAYVASGDPLDKAGAYAIQNQAFAAVASIEGCYANVVGLPLCALACLLRASGAAPPADVAARCTAALGYNCPGNYPACGDAGPAAMGMSLTRC